MEDYTSRYKGEAVEIALFGGEYQDGILTAYCLIEDVAHVELNGHILVPLQNVASLHCTSRCDAQDDWPPRGLFDDEREDRDGDDDDAAQRPAVSGGRPKRRWRGLPPEIRKPPPEGTAFVFIPAATYSPRPSQAKYHRR